MNALAEIKNRSDQWECRGPFACVGTGMTVEEAARDLEAKLDSMRDEIERWTGHRLTFDGDAYLV